MLLKSFVIRQGLVDCYFECVFCYLNLHKMFSIFRGGFNMLHKRVTYVE